MMQHWHSVPPSRLSEVGPGRKLYDNWRIGNQCLAVRKLPAEIIEGTVYMDPAAIRMACRPFQAFFKIAHHTGSKLRLHRVAMCTGDLSIAISGAICRLAAFHMRTRIQNIPGRITRSLQQLAERMSPRTQEEKVVFANECRSGSFGGALEQGQMAHETAANACIWKSASIFKFKRVENLESEFGKVEPNAAKMPGEALAAVGSALEADNLPVRKIMQELFHRGISRARSSIRQHAQTRKPLAIGICFEFDPQLQLPTTGEHTTKWKLHYTRKVKKQRPSSLLAFEFKC
jgi:hypothetical protein